MSLVGSMMNMVRLDTELKTLRVEGKMIKTIIKRDGSKEVYQASKLNKWGEWAAKNAKVDWSSIVIKAINGLPEEVSSEDLQNALIRECLNKKSWSYYLMAGRLYGVLLQKRLYVNGQMPTVKMVHEKLIKDGLMRRLDYSNEEYAEIEKFIRHDLDYETPHFSLEHIRRKYSLQNRVTGKEYETQQFVYMRMAMALAEQEYKEYRLEHVKNYYYLFSNKILSAPTPNYVNLGTNLQTYASCCLYDVKDTIDSLVTGDVIAYKMTAASAGIGNVIRTRSIGDPVRDGLIEHKGKLGYYASLGKAVKANLQNGRGGAATTYYSAFDPEGVTINQLRNPRSVEDKKNRDIHYALQTNHFFSQKVANNEEVFLFNAYTAPDLHEAFYSGNSKVFEELYKQYEENPDFKKTYINARDFLIHYYREVLETGTMYKMDMDNTNSHTPFKDPIKSSNLCVAPETLLLTKKGNQPIASLVDQEVEVWNGFEWSKTKVVKTGEQQKLLKVVLSNGRHLDCTEYHKWYVQRSYDEKDVVELRTHELEPGMRLIKFDFPIIEGEREMNKAYLNGFYTGDGTELGNGYGRISLYGDKIALEEILDPCGSWRDEHVRVSREFHGLYPKFFVPSTEFTIKSRLEWLAGLLDSDGTVYRNGETEAFVISSIHKDFLMKVSDLLTSLGISSKITLARAAGFNKLPANNFTGEYKDYYCQDSYRLIISAFNSQRLLKVGLKTNRLKLKEREVNREASWYVTVLGVLFEDRVDDTYCVNEPLRHMAVFNGILTGQCLEITQPTEAYNEVFELNETGDVGYVLFKYLTQDKEELVLKVPYSSAVTVIDEVGKETYKAIYELKKGDNFYLGYFNPEFVASFKCTPIKFIEFIEIKKEPEISLCNLAALAIENIKDDETYELAAFYALRMIDYCISNTKYVFKHLGFTAKQRRNAGVGIMGLATVLASKKLNYSSLDGKNEIHRIAERHAYFLIKASLKLSKELGTAPWMHRTKWIDGWLPIDTYNRKVDKLHTETLHYDWKTLRKEIIENGGIRNSSLISFMPGEASSKAVGTTNSIYPVRATTLNKTDNSTAIRWSAPRADDPNYQYTIAWDLPTKDLIECYAIIQKFTDQAISADLYKRISNDSKLSGMDLVKEDLYMTSLGIKTRYYVNSHTSDSASLDEVKKAIPTVTIPTPSPVVEDDYCESCAL